jgi:hypothetical protein
VFVLTCHGAESSGGIGLQQSGNERARRNAEMSGHLVLTRKNHLQQQQIQKTKLSQNFNKQTY